MVLATAWRSPVALAPIMARPAWLTRSERSLTWPERGMVPPAMGEA